jgi:opacity protein-like surface antigen
MAADLITKEGKMLKKRKAEKTAGIMRSRLAFFLLFLLGILWSGLPAQEEDEEEAEFKGVGIHVRLGGGYTLLSGGDIDTGLKGMQEWGHDILAFDGYTVMESALSPLRSGYEFGGDIVYYFAGRLGIGAGGSMARVNKTNELRYRRGTMPFDYSTTIVPQINILTLRLGLFYELPLNRLLSICFNAGPAYYSADYKLSFNLPEEVYRYSLTQKASAKKLGFQGGIGLEIRMNERMTFILEAQGRYAKISGFDGREEVYEYMGGPVFKSDVDGRLYYVEEEGYSRLEISEGAPPEGSNVREAVFDFSGVSFRAGLNFKF